jgi:hypothetical protein
VRTIPVRVVSGPVLALLCLLAGCRRDNVRIPPPEQGAAERPVPPPPASVVNLPVTISLASVAARVESKVPRGQNREDEWAPIGKFPVVGTLYVKEMWERDPLSLRIDGDRLDVSAHVRYRARIAAHPCVPLAGCRWVQLGSCGVDGPMPTVDVSLRTTLALRDDWTIAPRTRPRDVRTGVPCKLTEAKVDVTERVRGLVQGLLDRAAPQVDEKIREAAALRRRMEDVWSDVQQPIRASGDVYLLIQPESLSATPPRGQGTTLSTNVSVVVRPRVVVGDKPQIEETLLPPNAAVTPGRGFEVRLVAEIPFTEVDSILEKKLVGRAFDARGHQVTVIGARLYGSGGRVVLQLRVKGDARGTIYLVGTPRFDPATQVISVPDLDFSVETKDLLPAVADWLLYDQLRDQLRGAAHFELAGRIAKIRGDVDQAINRNLGRTVRMSGGVDEVRPVGVFVFSRALAAVVDAEGHAQIHVDVGARRRDATPDTARR